MTAQCSSVKQGFTLLELIIVIALLGILAAILLPKYIDLSQQATTAVIRQNGGTFYSALGTAHAKYIAQGATGGSITLPGPVVIPMNPNNWPGSVPMTDAACITIWNGLLASAPAVNTGFSPGSPGYGVIANGAGFCIYIYQPNTTPVKAVIYDAVNGLVTFFNV